MSWYRSYERESDKYVVKKKERKEERGWEERKAFFCLRWQGASTSDTAGMRARASGKIVVRGFTVGMCGNFW